MKSVSGCHRGFDTGFKGLLSQNSGGLPNIAEIALDAERQMHGSASACGNSEHSAFPESLPAFGGSDEQRLR
jgi:hypothetical protein